MRELTAKIILKELNKINEDSDYNDQFHFVELIIANEEEVLRQLEMDFNISNSINSKTRKIREVGFENDVHTYVFDGNGTKRICTKSNNMNKVKYEHRSYEGIVKLVESLKNECKDVLPKTPELINPNHMSKKDLVDYSEKCWKYYSKYLPKSQISFDGDKVLMPVWLARKNEFIL